MLRRGGARSSLCEQNRPPSAGEGAALEAPPEAENLGRFRFISSQNVLKVAPKTGIELLACLVFRRKHRKNAVNKKGSIAVAADESHEFIVIITVNWRWNGRISSSNRQS